jgi:hypothetical protein
MPIGKAEVGRKQDDFIIGNAQRSEDKWEKKEP